MRLTKLLICILVAGAATQVHAEAPPLEQQQQEWLLHWNALPEHPELAAKCSVYKSWAFQISGMKENGYPLEVTTNSIVQRSTRDTAGLDPLTAQAVETDMLHMVGTAYYGDYLYKMVRGGFVEYAYRNCLKDQPF